MGNLWRKGDILAMSFEEKKRYTIEDVRALPEGQRGELIEGRLYLMAPPTVIHQQLLMDMSAQIYTFVKKRKGGCAVLPAPLAVYLMNDDTVYVEPDLVVVCDRSKLDERGCHGAPDWVVEIVSPSSKHLDYYKKLAKYQEAGVREYWIVDPLKKMVVVYGLEQEALPVIYPFSGQIPSGLFPELTVQFQEEA